MGSRTEKYKYVQNTVQQNKDHCDGIEHGSIWHSEILQVRIHKLKDLGDHTYGWKSDNESG